MAGLVLLWWLAASAMSQPQAQAEQHHKLLQTYNDGNYKDALEGYRKLTGARSG